MALNRTTGELLSCHSIGISEPADDRAPDPVESLNRTEIDRITTLAKEIATNQGEITQAGEAQIVAFARQLDEEHRAAYERSGGRMTGADGEPTSPLWWISGVVLLAASAAITCLPAHRRGGP
ncbi:hypothetical protein ACPZ19_48740 [Amycolatopsis lurida]